MRHEPLHLSRSLTTRQQGGRLPPDGRFLAYSSNETGALEVYVQTWPPGGGKWQISNGGGILPRWCGDGKELHYRDAAGISTWTVTPDGQKFIVNASLTATQTPPSTVVLNWPETLAQK